MGVIISKVGLVAPCANAIDWADSSNIKVGKKVRINCFIFLSYDRRHSMLKGVFGVNSDLFLPRKRQFQGISITQK